jgi:hypothetical protein
MVTPEAENRSTGWSISEVFNVATAKPSEAAKTPSATTWATNRLRNNKTAKPQTAASVEAAQSDGSRSAVK